MEPAQKSLISAYHAGYTQGLLTASLAVGKIGTRIQANTDCGFSERQAIAKVLAEIHHELLLSVKDTPDAETLKPSIE